MFFFGLFIIALGFFISPLYGLPYFFPAVMKMGQAILSGFYFFSLIIALLGLAIAMQSMNKL